MEAEKSASIFLERRPMKNKKLLMILGLGMLLNSTLSYGTGEDLLNQTQAQQTNISLTTRFASCGVGVLHSLSVGSNGQVLVGATGSAPAFATLGQLSDFMPNRVHFAWDVNDVLVSPSFLKMFKIGGKEGCKIIASACGQYMCYCFTGKIGKEQQLLSDVCTQISNGGTFETIQQLLRAYDSKIEALAQQVAAEQYLINGMAELIKELKELGYTQRLASNIGSNEIKLLQTKFPEVFSIFDGGKTVTYNADGTHSEKKPSLQYFQEYKQAYNADQALTIIFIDDKKKNVEAAAKEGFIALHFKNAEQLRADLKALGIPLA